MALIELISEKSQESLNVGSFKFHSFYLISLNFVEGVRLDHINHHRTLLVYLPIEFQYLVAESRVCNNNSAKVPLSPIDALQKLHESVEFTMKIHFRHFYLVSPFPHQMDIAS